MEIRQLRAPISSALEEQLLAQGRDYLHRSREELYPEEEDLLLSAALTGLQPGLRLIGAVEGDRLVAWALLRFAATTMAVGPELVIWQLYVDPRHGRLREFVGQGMAEIERLAREWGCTRLTAHVRRFGRGYMRMLQRLGFEPHSLVLTREVMDERVQTGEV